MLTLKFNQDEFVKIINIVCCSICQIPGKSALNSKRHAPIASSTIADTYSWNGQVTAVAEASKITDNNSSLSTRKGSRNFFRPRFFFQLRPFFSAVQNDRTFLFKGNFFSLAKPVFLGLSVNSHTFACIESETW